jgi:RHS repeat-associated protein
MIKKLLVKLTSLTLIMLCSFGQASAQFQEGIELSPVFSNTNGVAVLANATNSLQSYITDPKQILNVITFKINETGATNFASSFTATVNFDLEFTDFNGTITNSTNNSLTVNYDNTPGAKYKILDYKTFKNFNKIKITFTSPITYSQAPAGWNPLLVLDVNNEMRTTVYNSLSSVPANLVPILNPLPYLPTPDVLKVSWKFVPQAHENMTQLEWAFVEDEMISFYGGDFNAIFQNNSTRIDLEYSDRSKEVIDNNNYVYKIPALLPLGGKLYYRMRAVQRKANGTLIAGEWSTVSAEENVGNKIIPAHEPNLNWQSSTSFAEGGKSKTVIQYFDGSLRGRQIVTKDNTTGNTVVGETIYDLQGRPNIQILPTPTNDQEIKYFRNFNKFGSQQIIANTDGTFYNDDPAKYFDLTIAAVRCQGADTLDRAYGNAKYYSSNNPWLTGTSAEAKSKYIPDAQGYAYTETRFMDDATERVYAQSGVGKDHQIGSGHETNYLYGKPSQPELDALFGTEVGYADHYSKNVVKDANGQRSVSYVDMHGRTIATALAGDPTAGIDSIINPNDYPLIDPLSSIKYDLLTPTTNIIQGNSIVSVSTFTTSATTAASFVYKLNPPILQLLSCTNSPICFDCKYDLEISIRSEACDADSPVVRKYNNLQLVPANVACNTPMGFIGNGYPTPVTEINFQTSLPAGSYVIRKTLTINDSMFQVRRDSAVKALLCKTKDSLIKTIFDSLVIATGCGVSPAQQCSTCLDSLGTLPQYTAKYLQSIAPATATLEEIHTQYSIDSTDCANMCSDLDTCASNITNQMQTLVGLRNQMLADMKPFTGQYATDTITSTLVGGVYVPNYSSIDAKYNIFTTAAQYDNSKGTTYPKPFFRKPHHETNLPRDFYYADDNQVDNTIHANILPVTNPITFILDTINRGNVVPAVNSHPFDQNFSTLFQNNWANSLIEYHPEYSKLKFAEQYLRSTYDWADRVNAVVCYQRALDSNFINPLISDPYFLLPNTQLDKDTLTHYLLSGISYPPPSAPLTQSPSIWQLANAMVLCATVDSANKYGCYLQRTNNGLEATITNAAKKNEVWDHFKTAYLSYRNEMVLRYIQNNAPNAIQRPEINLLLAEDKDLVFANFQDANTQNSAAGGVIWANYVAAANTSNYIDTTGLAVYTAANGLNNCEGQRPFWKARLKNCEALKTLLNNNTADSLVAINIINTILDSMVMVCQNALNPQQPYGSSTVSPTFVGTPRSFESVINNVLNANGIATPPSNYFCNPYTIEFPKPYGLNPPLFVNTSNTLDSCACKRFGILQAEAAASTSPVYNPASFTSMNQFLILNYKDSLTLPVWNGLQQCSTMYTDTCCKKPVITSLIFGPSGGLSSTTINYTLPSNCSNCSLYLYNQNNALISTYTGLCGTNSYTSNDFYFLVGVTKFLIKCQGSTCGTLISDTSYIPTYNRNLLSNMDKDSINSLLSNNRNNPISENDNNLPQQNSDINNVSNVTDNSTRLSVNCVFCVLNVNNRAQYNQPVRYKAKCEINFLPGFESLPSDNFEAIIDTNAILCYTTGCVKPIITSNVPEFVNSVIHVNYQLPANCDSCKLKVYSTTGTLLQTINNICNTTTTDYNIGITDTCTKYKFVLSCYNDTCGYVNSDTSYYNGCIPIPTCTKPVITNVIVNGTAHSFQVFYNLTPGCDSCKIYMHTGNILNSANIVGYNGNICGTSSYTFTSPLYDSCTGYQFTVKCYKAGCENPTSLTYSYKVKCPVVNCLVYNPILLQEPAVIPPFLNCGYVKPCISCGKIDALTTEFRVKYPAYIAAPYLQDNSTLAQTEINNLWARFINYRVGFTKKAIDYAIAYRTCHPIDSTGTPTAPPPATSNALCAFDPPLNSPYFSFDSLPLPIGPCDNAYTQAQFMAQLQFNSIKESLKAKFDSLYMAKCLSAQYLEEFYINYKPKEYHYTLYYYDQAGNLVKTMPPAAVKPNYTALFLSKVKVERLSDGDLTNPLNNDSLATNYRYNSLNQVIEQKTPDAGISKFWYDRLGRLVVSQNAKQQLVNNYSYTQYDDLGRITTVGEKPQTQLMSQAISQNETDLATWLADVGNGGQLKKQITRTVYDVGYFNANQPTLLQPVLTQTNLRNRVSYTQLINEEPADFATNEFAYVGAHSAATYYSYDIHGNVDTLVQDFNEGHLKYVDPYLLPGDISAPSNLSGNRFKKMVYDYDLVSGKVNKVSYQPSMTDQFYHKYGYDAENRITKVEVSHDSIYWEKDASYEYYRHGPLNRTVLGQNQVQGLDYAYTIQGWLKGVNSTAIKNNAAANPTSNTSFDMGGDDLQNTPSGGRGADAFGFSLNYFYGDYKPIGLATPAFNQPFTNVTNNLTAATDGVQLGKDLFNGNIRAMLVNIPSLGVGGQPAALLYGYRYDQLNRIKAMNSFSGFDNATNDFGTTNTPTITENYKERVTYDPNGNIKTYLRNGTTIGGTPLQMDNFDYSYNTTAGQLQNNKLRHVKDAIAATNYTEDVDNQNDDNFKYDAIGNLVQDKAEGIYDPANPQKNMIEWTVYGKISSITKIKNGTTTIKYTYDASGNRISKYVLVTPQVVYPIDPSVPEPKPTVTYYVRDASGNVMSVYSLVAPAANTNAELTQTEVSLYGSSRLGVWNLNRSVANIEVVNYTAFSSNFTRGNKMFELSNHLGNVLVTVSDKRIAVDSDNDGIINYYSADVVTANDYYPFGMTMPGRKYSQSTSSYRYGFNGKENDKDAGEGIQDYGMRIYDCRLGRFLSTDPITKSYPELTPYQFASNTPIQGVDLDGLELYFSVDGSLIGKFGKDLTIRLVSDREVVRAIKQDVKNKLNLTEKEFSSYKINSSTLYETLRQITETKKSALPIGLASVVTAKGEVIQGSSQAAFIDASGLLTTPETLPVYTPPILDADKERFTVIHAHSLDAFTKNASGDFEKVAYDVPISGLVYNVGNVNKVNPSSVDLQNISINNKNYNLILVGNVSPIKLTEKNPMQSNGPKVLSEGTAGATFYKGSFNSVGFDMTEKALEKVKNEDLKQVKEALKGFRFF